MFFDMTNRATSSNVCAPRALSLRYGILTIGSAACLVAVSACEQISPARVCQAPETITGARQALLNQLVGDDPSIDIDQMDQAFADVVRFELITFEGYDRQTRLVRCKAQLSSPTITGGADVTYTRQPEASGKGYVYTLEWTESPTLGRIGLAINRRFRALETRPTDQSSATQSTNETEQVDDANGDGDGQISDLQDDELAYSARRSAVTGSNPSPTPGVDSNRNLSTSFDVNSPAPEVLQRKEDRVQYTGPPVIVPGPPTHAPPAPPRPFVITNPYWTRQPAPDFPEQAKAIGVVSGVVTLDCAIQQNGSLSGCTTVREQPTGAGFSQAALVAAQRARLSQRTVDSAAQGGRTRFTVSFHDGSENR